MHGPLVHIHINLNNMFPRLLAVCVAVASIFATALGSGVLVPLYIYPGDACSAWTPLFNAFVFEVDIRYI